MARASGHVLLVEDDESDRRLAMAALQREDRKVRAVETVEDAREALSHDRFQALVLDLVLPDGDGRELLAEIRERPRSANLPVVVLSARGSRGTRLDCFRLGADEFFEKPFDGEILDAAVERQLQRARSFSVESRTDPVTELPNRAALVERFRTLQPLAERGNEPLVVALLDIDGFRQLREDREAEAADELLVAFASVLRDHVRSPDFAGRWAEGEFLILLPGTSVPAAVESLQELQDRVRAEASTPLTFSAGIVDGREFAGVRRAIFAAEPALLTAQVAGGASIATRTAEEEPVGEAGGAERPGTGRILVVEDDPVGAELVRHRLERSGFEVEHFDTGSGARDRIEGSREANFDLLLFDVKLPGMDGFELLQLVRDRPGWCEVPVVMLTSMGEEDDIVRAFELGARDYILKPFSPAELLARVHRLLRTS